MFFGFGGNGRDRLENVDRLSMTLDFWIKTVDLEEYEIISMELNNHKLILCLLGSSHLALIANGYRPEMNVEYRKTFCFHDVSLKDYRFTKPYILEYLKKEKDIFYFKLCGVEVRIPNQNIEIE